MSVRGAIFLGVGSMVGAGIFALLGEAGAVAGSAVWISFLLAGIVAGLLGYTAVKLGVRYPSSGGIITYLIEGFGNGRLVGIASWLGYIAAIVIVGAMVAVSFGSYATALFIGQDAGPAWDNVFTTAVVLGTLGINLIGSRIVDRAQTVIVVVELAVFAVFIVVTISDVDWELLAFSGYPRFSDILASVALTFFAFLGFSVITFSAGDLEDPAHGLPRAMYTALGIAAGLYILISLGVFGTLTVDQVVDYGETAIAEAARPALGDAGFVMMAIAALLATTSSVNATLYASGGLTGMLAGVGQFPPVFGRKTRGGVHIGLLVTAGAGARRGQSGRPVRDRIGRQRHRAGGLRARRARRLPPAPGHGRQPRDRRGDDRGFGHRAHLLRRRHAAQRPGDLRRHAGHRRCSRSSWTSSGSGTEPRASATPTGRQPTWQFPADPGGLPARVRVLRRARPLADRRPCRLAPSSAGERPRRLLLSARDGPTRRWSCRMISHELALPSALATNCHLNRW